jgi:HEAT repeat protein
MRRLLVLVLVGLPLGVAALAFASPPANGVALMTEVQALRDKKKEVRLQAVQRLGSWGAAAALAAPQLSQCLQHDADADVANQAALALAKIGPAGARELVKAAQSSKQATRHRALWALGKMGPDAREALDGLQTALQESNPTLRALAAQALGEMGAEATPAVTALCRALRDQDAEVRHQAAQALANLGPAAVPDLQTMLADDDPVIRHTALHALALQGPDAAPAVADLAKLLKDEVPTLRYTATVALAALGPVAKEATAELLEAMKDEQLPVQQGAFQALRRVNADDVPGLLDALRKLNEEHHWAGPLVLTQFGPQAKDAVKPLMAQLQAPEDSKRLMAALALGQIGPEAKDAIPSLQNALKDPHPQVQQSAAFALGLIQSDLVPEVGKVLDIGLANADKNQATLRLKLDQLQQTINAKQPGWQVPHPVDKAKVVKGRPVDRQALFDPQVQQHYEQFVNLHITISVELNRLSRKYGLCPTRYVHLLPPLLRKLYQPNTEAINAFAPEAVPALMLGVGQAIQFRLGFT